MIRDYSVEMKRLRKFNDDNHKRFGSGISKSVPKRQLYILTESVFFSAYKAFEGYLRDIFLLYCMGKKTSVQVNVQSYLNAKNFQHAELLIQSSMPYLDWASPDNVIQRSELYLKDGYPIKLPFTSNIESLRELKRIRNRIAHSSKEAINDYKKVLRKHYRVLPLTLPDPGEFLLEVETYNPSTYKLLTYLNIMESVASDIV